MSEEDHILLRRYADEKSEEAFAALVRRHLDLVYSVALRQVGGDVHLAQDVAQTVFTTLARKAASLAARPVLGGWLYRTAQFTAIDVVRAESRRRARELEAPTMNDFSRNPNLGADVDWEKLRPTLDQAIGELDDDDRDAVVLRFFEGKTYGEVGAKLRLTENTARMRVERALDKLHALLARRGVTSTSAALAGALANQAATAAPAGLAATVTGAALAGSAAGAGAVGVGIFAFMNIAKLVVGVAVLVGIGTAFLGVKAARDADAALTASTTRERALETNLKELETREAGESRRLREAEATYAKLSSAAKQVDVASAVPAADTEQVTSDMVTRRFKLAQELVRSGDPAAALKELLWCYDVGMPKISGMSAVRTTSLSLFGELGLRYPPALEVLRERREQAKEVMMTSEREFAATQEFAAANRALKDDAANVTLLDQLPAGDQRRRTLAGASYDYLVENRRYGDAVEGRPYGSISSSFELMINREPAPDLPNRDEAVRSGHDYLITATATNIEALAGAGDLASARNLAERLFAYDPSESTRALVQKHVARAGQPTLFDKPATK